MLSGGRWWARFSCCLRACSSSCAWLQSRTPDERSLVNRRAFVTGLGAVLAAPRGVEAQQAATRRVGVYSDAARTGPLPPELLEAFRGGLREHGWVEGQNLVVEFRESRTIEERPAAVASLLRTKPEVIVTSGIGAFIIRPSANRPGPFWSPVRDIPIVFAGQSDPVGSGLVESLARPGGSVTGLSYMGVELNSKRLQMLKELIPTLSRVGLLVPS